jgi:hypothetical protein
MEIGSFFSGTQIPWPVVRLRDFLLGWLKVTAPGKEGKW